MYALVELLVEELKCMQSGGTSGDSGGGGGGGADGGGGRGSGGDAGVPSAVAALPLPWRARLSGLEAKAATTRLSLPPLSTWLEAALEGGVSARHTLGGIRGPAPPRSPLHDPRRTLCTALLALRTRAVRPWFRKCCVLVHAARGASGPAAALCAPNPEAAISILTDESPAAALAYTLAVQPVEACEHSAQARGAWTSLLAALSARAAPTAGQSASGQTASGQAAGQAASGAARDAVLAILADSLPPPSLFAVLASAEAMLSAGESDLLRQRSLAHQASRSLGSAAMSLVLAEYRDTAWHEPNERDDDEARERADQASEEADGEGRAAKAVGMAPSDDAGEDVGRGWQQGLGDPDETGGTAWGSEWD